MKKSFSIILTLIFSFLLFSSVSAQTGIINKETSYAWSNNIGWINFAPVDANNNYIGLNITDELIIGEAWSQNFGWIHFSPQNGGVKNNKEGTLSGYAFGDNLGWISFSSVKIDCDGKINGQATGEVVGSINFDCENCLVKTNWLPEFCDKKNHNECNQNQQCVLVSGSGQNQCQIDQDCIGVDPFINPDNPENPENFREIISFVGGFLKTIKNIIENPLVSVLTKITSTGALVGGAIATTIIALSSNISLTQVLLSPLRLLGAFMTALGLKKRTLPWGVVYDSVTKQPLDPAYVTLKDSGQKDLASAITDIDGRFGFLVLPGSYFLTSQKTNYAFPSQKMVGKNKDEIYSDLYFGEKIEVLKSGAVITKNIPLDPIKFDWNEFAKKNKTFMKFYSRWDAFLRKISDLFFAGGFLVAIVSFIFAPYPYNTIIFVLYLLVLLLRTFGIKPKSFGYVIEKSTGNPLSFAILRIMMPSTNVEISHKIADKYGRYYCLVPRGKYYLKIEKKNDDASYSLIYTSAVIDASKKGIINNKFEI